MPLRPMKRLARAIAVSGFRHGGLLWGRLAPSLLAAAAPGSPPSVVAAPLPAAAPGLFDPDLQLGHRRLPGGPAGGHPSLVPILQTPIGSLPLTVSANRRAIPLGTWMSRQSRVRWRNRIAPHSGSSRSSIRLTWVVKGAVGSTRPLLLPSWLPHHTDRQVKRKTPHQNGTGQAIAGSGPCWWGPGIISGNRA